MDKTITGNFIRVKKIDTFHKLQILLFLHQYPKMVGTCQEFAEQLYLGDLLVEEAIYELQKVGLIVRDGDCWKLANEPEVKEQLQHLSWSFESPLTRQELLAWMKL